MAEPEAIATVELVWTKPSGEQKPLTARVAAPYRRPTGEWACPFQVDTIDPKWRDSVGDTSWQALALAMRLVRSQLAHRIAGGDRLHFPDSPDETVDAAYLDALFGVDSAERAP